MTGTTTLNLSLPAARRILDFGCGPGSVIVNARKQGDPHCVGIDCSFEALQKAKVNPGLSLALADGLRLPFADESFDVVIGHVSMPYMNTRLALREIYRVLAPGGSFLLTFHSFHFLRLLLASAFRGKHWKVFVFSIYVAVNGVLNHLSLPQSQVWWKRRQFETVNTRRGVYRTAREEGFVLISTEHAGNRIFFTATARKPNPPTGAVLPHPGWSVYCDLSGGLGSKASSASS